MENTCLMREKSHENVQMLRKYYGKDTKKKNPRLNDYIRRKSRSIIKERKFSADTQFNFWKQSKLFSLPNELANEYRIAEFSGPLEKN